MPRLMPVTFAALAIAVPAHAGDLALTRVMLSTGGVGYVEYSADVDGAATLGLDVKLDQVDDVLQSLVVYDSAGGVAGIELPGRDGATAAFADLPFGEAGFASPLAYLNSLRGVALTVAGPRPMTGRLLQAESVAVESKDAKTTRTQVSLLTADGLRQFVLEDADSVEVADPALRAAIGRALDTLRRQAGSTTRHITVHGTATATGPHTVRVGYVAGAPLWKTTYRVILPQAGGDKARLQGWAVLENTTGADWNGVQLVLQYGNPVTFRQALYRSYFVQRPEVPVEILGRVLPDIDSRAVPVPPPPGAPPRAAAAAPMMMRGMAAPAPAAKAEPPVMAAPSQQTEVAEGAEETVFRLPAKVVLEAGHTASLPILDREVSAARVGLVQAARPHPLSAIRITNDTGSSLPAGVLTLYDPGSPADFAGDARLGGLPAGESRLLSFAEDLRTGVSWKDDEATTIASVAAASGVLRVDERLRWTSRITLTAPAGEARSLLVELPRRADATLSADNALKPAETTDQAWRFAVSLAAGETRIVVLASEHVTRQQISLLDDDDGVATTLIGRPGLSPQAMAALQHLADLRARKAAADAKVEQIGTQVTQTEADEDRIRKNLAAVPATDALHLRLVRQLDAAETRIDTLRGSVTQAQASADQAQHDLEAAVGSLTI